MPRLLVTAGRMDARADLACAVWAFDILQYTDPGVWLAVAGYGPERQRLERYARSVAPADLRVRFGAVTVEAFAAAEQVWVPHRAGGEKLALAAMAGGRPVLAADTPELRDTLGDAGLFFPPGDRVRLAALARKLLHDPAAADRLGDAGRRRAGDFAGWRLLDPLAAVYHEAGVPPAR